MTHKRGCAPKAAPLRFSVLTLALAAALALSGCAPGAPKTLEVPIPPSPDKLGNLPKQIAIISPAKTSDFHKELPEGAKDEAAKLGWPVPIDQSPEKENDYSGQVALVQDVLQQRPEALSVCGINPDSLRSIVIKANANSVPIFIHNQISPVPDLPKDVNVVAYVGYDERDGGRKCGEEALKLLKAKYGDYKGTVAILDGEPGTHTDDRAGGFKAALAAYPGIKVVAEQNGQWLRAPSASVTKDWLQKYPTLDLVFGCSDQMAQGASEAAAQANHTMFTIGIDGNNGALHDVQDGKLTATLAVQPRAMGAAIVDTMAKFFKKQKIPKVVKTDSVIVTKENVNKFL